MTEEFRLTDAERASHLWLRLKEHMQARLDTHRAGNDGTTVNEVQTAVLRGRIAECKAFVALDKPRPVSK